jgi:hypothetical protein
VRRQGYALLVVEGPPAEPHDLDEVQCANHSAEEPGGKPAHPLSRDKNGNQGGSMGWRRTGS